MRRRAGPIETVSVTVPEAALDAYEAALATSCGTIGFFLDDEDARIWRVEGVRDTEAELSPLLDALSIAALVTGVTASLARVATEAEGWVQRTQEAFPEQLVGHRFAIRGTHDAAPRTPGRITLVLDAGLAFGSGEHGSTRGCLRALELVARRRPRRLLDLGAGSGILAMAAARLLRRPVLATDIEPWSVRVARQNAALNGVAHLVTAALADGWRSRGARSRAPYDLVFANILARPLCRMAGALAKHLAPGGHAILSGLLLSQVPMVLTAHRRHGLVLTAVVREGGWATLVVRQSDPAATDPWGNLKAPTRHHR